MRFLKLVDDRTDGAYPDAQFIGYSFTLPEATREWMNNAIGVTGNKFYELKFPNAIELPCGNKVEFNTPEDIPLESVPCPCGDPSHWLVEVNITPKSLLQMTQFGPITQIKQ